MITLSDEEIRRRLRERLTDTNEFWLKGCEDKLLDAVDVAVLGTGNQLEALDLIAEVFTLGCEFND